MKKFNSAEKPRGRNVAKKSTSNRPLRTNIPVSAKFSAISSHDHCPSLSSIYTEDTEDGSCENSGIFSVSNPLTPYLRESNFSPIFCDDSSNDSLESFMFRNCPVNDAPPRAKKDLVSKAISSDVRADNILNKSSSIAPKSGVLVKEDFLICEGKAMKMIVVEHEDYDVVGLQNYIDEADFQDNCVVDQSDFLKIVCAFTMSEGLPGDEVEFQDFPVQHTETAQNLLPTSVKTDKKHNSSRDHSGLRGKRKRKNSKRPDHSTNAVKISPVQESASHLNYKQLPPGSHVAGTSGVSSETELQENCHTINSSCHSNGSGNSDAISPAESSGSIDEKRTLCVADTLRQQCLDNERKIKEKKKHLFCTDKKMKREINEGVLLHVEAARDTDIMRDGRLLKDKEELLKDIESKIEQNIPVEVKGFDIQQSLTEQILLDQALRLAHQRTSPRFRSSKPQPGVKTVPECLSNLKRHNNYKKSKPEVDGYGSVSRDKNANFIPCQKKLNYLDDLLKESATLADSTSPIDNNAITKSKDVRNISGSIENIQCVENLNKYDKISGKKRGPKGKKKLCDLSQHFVDTENEPNVSEMSKCEKTIVIVIKNRKVVDDPSSNIFNIIQKKDSIRIDSSLDNSLSAQKDISLSKHHQDTFNSEIENNDNKFSDNSVAVQDSSIENYNNNNTVCPVVIIEQRDIECEEQSEEIIEVPLVSSRSSVETEDLNSSSYTVFSKRTDSITSIEDQQIYPENIVKVIDKNLVKVDSPKQSLSDDNSVFDKIIKETLVPNTKMCSIPFLDNTDSSFHVFNKESYSPESLSNTSDKSEKLNFVQFSPNTNPEQKDIDVSTNIGHPVPRISELEQHSPQISDKLIENNLKNPSLSLPLHDSIQRTLPINVSSGCSSGDNSVFPTFYDSCVRSFSSVEVPISSHLTFENPTTSENNILLSSCQPSMNSSFYWIPLDPNAYQLPSNSDSYTLPQNSRISSVLQAPPVYGYVPSTSTANMQSPQILSSNIQFSGHSYSQRQNNSSCCNLDSLPPKNITTPSIVNQEQRSNPDQITLSLKSECEVSAQEESRTANFPSIPDLVKRKVCDIPLSIAARDPRLCKKNIRVSIDGSCLLELKPIEKLNYNVNTNPLSQNNTDVDNSNNQRSATETESKKNQAEERESNRQKIEHEAKKLTMSRTKQINKELFYKTPPGQSSYSRTTPRRPRRSEFYRDARSFRQKDTGFSSGIEHEQQQETSVPHFQYRQPFDYQNQYRRTLPDCHNPHVQTSRRHEQRYEDCLNDQRRAGYHFKMRQDDFSQGFERSRVFSERHPLLETPRDFRKSQWRSYGHDYAGTDDSYQESLWQDHFNNRRFSNESAYAKWDYTHNKVEGGFLVEDQESTNSYLPKSSHQAHHQFKSRESESEIKDLIKGPMLSGSRLSYRWKHFSSPRKTSITSDKDLAESSSSYRKELFVRRRNKLEYKEGSKDWHNKRARPSTRK